MSERGDVYYITTAIDYANGLPHLGHALEKIGADAMARYHRLKDGGVHFVIGMDEHGLKVLQSARDAGVSPQEWVDDIAREFLSAWEELAISHDDFIRTTQPRHRRAVEAMIARMERAGDLYRDTYAGYYCVGCEAFKREEELEAVAEGSSREAGSAAAAEASGDGEAAGSREGRASGSGGEGKGEGEGKGKGEGAGRVVEGWRCPIHPSRPILWSEETNWFFRLSRYQQPLLEALEERPELVQPEIRRNEIRNVIEGGLEDISVSRTRLPWGIPWPGDPEQTVYVWIDALTNYLSAIGFPDEGYHRRWPADVHVIGKDITRFHCVYWPAMLMSAGIELPRSVWAHGFVTYRGGKLSKSEGATFSLGDAIERHGPDALRYYLLRDVPWGGDGEVSRERFDAVYTAELANDLGNLANRVLAMIDRYRDGVIPDGARTSLDEDIAGARERYVAALDGNLLNQGAAAAMELASVANGYVEARSPWSQAKDPAQADDLDVTLAALARALAALATLLGPYLPRKMGALAHALGLDAPPRLTELESLDLGGREVRPGPVLFPRE